MMVPATKPTKPQVNYLLVKDRHLTESLKSQVSELQAKMSLSSAEIERLERVVVSTKQEASEKLLQAHAALEEIRQQAADADEAHTKRYAENEKQLLAEHVNQRSAFEAKIAALEAKIEEGTQREQAIAGKLQKKKDQTNILKKEVLYVMRLRWKKMPICRQNLRVVRAELKKLTGHYRRKNRPAQPLCQPRLNSRIQSLVLKKPKSKQILDY